MRKHVLLVSLASCALALAACSERHDQGTDLARAERVTPMDQPNAAADVDVTRAIRDAITSDDSMSIEARNVTVVSQSGVVTLRGPVQDDEEKAAILAIAMRTPGVSRVDDQLTVAQ